MIKPTDSPSLRQFGHFIPLCNGVNQVLGATDQIDGSQSNGTGPASRQLQDKTGGVAPAGLLLIERSVAAPEVVSAATAGSRSTPWNRSPISYGGFGKGASPRPILRLRLWPKTVIDRVWPILSASCRPTIKTGTAARQRECWHHAAASPCGRRERAKPAGAFVRSAADISIYENA